MRREVRDLESDLHTYQAKLEEYRTTKDHRAHYEEMYLDALHELRREPMHVWKPFVVWYVRYQGW